MRERLFNRREYRRKERIRILFERGLNLFFSLPHRDDRHVDGPSWGEIATRKIKSLPRIDRRFLLEDTEKQRRAKVCVDFEEQGFWVGIEVLDRRVRYLAKNPVLEVLHEVKTGEVWENSSLKERDEWEDFERVIGIGESLLVS